jgi:hypothetical protein
MSWPVQPPPRDAERDVSGCVPRGRVSIEGHSGAPEKLSSMHPEQGSQDSHESAGREDSGCGCYEATRQIVGTGNPGRDAGIGSVSRLWTGSIACCASGRQGEAGCGCCAVPGIGGQGSGVARPCAPAGAGRPI